MFSWKTWPFLNLHVRFFCPEIRFLPPCSECDLYYVNRDTLFSYHRDSELFLQVKPDLSDDVGWVVINIFTFRYGAKMLTFLQRMMALYVASDYKNSPNDIQLMADAPAHHLFVLLGILGSLSSSALVPHDFKLWLWLCCSESENLYIKGNCGKMWLMRPQLRSWYDCRVSKYLDITTAIAVADCNLKS